MWVGNVRGQGKRERPKAARVSPKVVWPVQNVVWTVQNVTWAAQQAVWAVRLLSGQYGMVSGPYRIACAVQNNRLAKQMITCRNTTTIQLWKTVDLTTVPRTPHVHQRRSLFFGRIDDDDFDDSSIDLAISFCFASR